jgi:CheY-like chemotaxis protein
MNAKILHLLLIDDDEVDREAVGRGFDVSGIPHVITVAKNGVEALAVLHASADLPAGRPHLILLDLNMPQMGGLSFLDALRADPEFRNIIVIALTTSTRNADVTAAYERNVAAYIAKSSVGEDCADLVQFINCYWRMAEFPTPTEEAAFA